MVCDLRHSLTTRFICNCISSHLFDKQKTLDDLHNAFADEAEKLFYEGVQVTCMLFGFSLANVGSVSYYADCLPQVAPNIRLYFACIAGKGDWKYLRQAFQLNCKSIKLP